MPAFFKTNSTSQDATPYTESGNGPGPLSESGPSAPDLAGENRDEGPARAARGLNRRFATRLKSRLDRL